MNCISDIKADNTEQISAKYSPYLTECSSGGNRNFSFIDFWTQSSILNHANQKLYYGTGRLKEIKIVKYTQINNLINFNYTLKKPIQVKIIRNMNADVIGDIEELELYSFGKDEFEVLRELNEELTDLFEDLMSIKDENLGKLPKKWKIILKNYIKK